MPIFASWQELQVYFRSAHVSSPGMQVYIVILRLLLRKNLLVRLLIPPPPPMSSLYVVQFLLSLWEFLGNSLRKNMSVVCEVCFFYSVLLDWTAEFTLNHCATGTSFVAAEGALKKRRSRAPLCCASVSMPARVFVRLYSCAQTSLAGCCWFF